MDNSRKYIMVFSICDIIEYSFKNNSSNWAKEYHYNNGTIESPWNTLGCFEYQEQLQEKIDDGYKFCLVNFYSDQFRKDKTRSKKTRGAYLRVLNEQVQL